MRLFIGLFLVLGGLNINKIEAQMPDSILAIFKFACSGNPVYQSDSTFRMGDVVINRITYFSTDSFKVSAYMTLPVNETGVSHPFILFNHWGEGDKSEFLQEAITFSNSGFICMLPDEPWLCPDSPIKSFTRQGYEMFRQAVMNARVALDLVEAHYNIDKSNIFCVGHSFGCAVASMLSGIETRIDYFVFMTGLSSTTLNAATTTRQDFVDWREGSAEQFRKWIERMKPLDADRYLPFKEVPCLIQVAQQDEYITEEENKLFINATSDPKDVLAYDAGHALNDRAREDRIKWIKDRVSP
jgi:cephalosporin-C deacetylase-like acetyl esterase